MSSATPLEAALAFLGRTSAEVPLSAVPGLKDRVIAAVKLQGEFPGCSVLIEHAREVSSSRCTPAQVMEAIYEDPLSAARLFAAANEIPLARRDPAATLSAAVKQLGIWRLSSVLTQLGRSEDYRHFFQDKVLLLSALEEFSLAVLLAAELSSAATKDQRTREKAQILAILLNLPLLLLAYCTPHLYAVAALDGRTAGRARRIQELFGIPSHGMSDEIARALSFPHLFPLLLARCNHPARAGEAWSKKDEPARIAIASAQIGAELARLLFRLPQPADFLAGCQNIARDYCVPFPRLVEAAPAGLAMLAGRWRRIGLTPIRPLPADGVPEHAQPVAERFGSFLSELRRCFAAPELPPPGRVPQAVYCTLLALVQAVNFDRALLFLSDSESDCLLPALYIGAAAAEVVDLDRSLPGSVPARSPAGKSTPAARAVPAVPALCCGRPSIEFPIVSGGRSLALFYADRVHSTGPESLTLQEQAAIVALSEQWHDVPPDFY